MSIRTVLVDDLKTLSLNAFVHCVEDDVNVFSGKMLSIYSKHPAGYG